MFKIKNPGILRENDDTTQQKTNINDRSKQVQCDEEHLSTSGIARKINRRNNNSRIKLKGTDKEH